MIKIIKIVSIIVFLTCIILILLNQVLKNVSISVLLISLLKSLSYKIIIGFYLIIFISIFLIIIYIFTFKLLNIKILFNLNFKPSFLINSKLKIKTKNIVLNNKTNISLEYLLIIILVTILLLSIQCFSASYFFLGTFSSNIFYIFISLFLLFQVKIILHTIFYFLF